MSDDRAPGEMYKAAFAKAEARVQKIRADRFERFIAEELLEDLNGMIQDFPPGPYRADQRGDGWEVRQLDTDPTNEHHWPYRLCQSVQGQKSAADPFVFEFIASVINAWPLIYSALSAEGSANAAAARKQAAEEMRERAANAAFWLAKTGATAQQIADTLRDLPLPPSSSPEDQEKAKAAAIPTIADPDGESGR